MKKLLLLFIPLMFFFGCETDEQENNNVNWWWNITLNGNTYSASGSNGCQNNTGCIGEANLNNSLIVQLKIADITSENYIEGGYIDVIIFIDKPMEGVNSGVIGGTGDWGNYFPSLGLPNQQGLGFSETPVYLSEAENPVVFTSFSSLMHGRGHVNNIEVNSLGLSNCENNVEGQFSGILYALDSVPNINTLSANSDFFSIPVEVDIAFSVPRP